MMVEKLGFSAAWGIWVGPYLVQGAAVLMTSLFRYSAGSQSTRLTLAGSEQNTAYSFLHVGSASYQSCLGPEMHPKHACTDFG